jgi:hypothetical protein
MADCAAERGHTDKPQLKCVWDGFMNVIDGDCNRE